MMAIASGTPFKSSNSGLIGRCLASQLSGQSNMTLLATVRQTGICGIVIVVVDLLLLLSLL
jgi:hypothetical protein